MNRTRTTIAGVAALLAVAAVITAAVALAAPTSTQAAAAEVPVRIHDAGDAFEVRWSVPDDAEVTGQFVTAWTDDGYGRDNLTYASAGDGDRSAVVELGRDHDAGTAFGFRVTMTLDGAAVSSRDHYRYPLGPMAKSRPSGLTVLRHHDQLRLHWTPGRNPNYVGQVAKCRPAVPGADWTEVELSRPTRRAAFRDLDADQKYVCRIEARKANGHYQMTPSVDAKPRRVATPVNISLDDVDGKDEGNDVRFGWSLDDTAGISKLLVQREGPMPEYSSHVYPGWQTLAELEPDATSYVDTLVADVPRKFYNFRVIAVAERGGDAVGKHASCIVMLREHRQGNVWHVCGPNADW